MKFCSECESQLYIKNSEDELGNEFLIYYCQKCNTESTEKVDSLVHSQTYNTNFNSHKYIKNEYTMYDNTLPRVSNIKCVNEKCISNDTRKLFIVTDINEDKIIEDDQEESSKFNKIAELFDDILQTFEVRPNITFEYSNFIKSHQILVIVEADSPSDYNMLCEYISDNPYKINYKISPIQNEIIYIKTNNENLKFMYICSNCKSSWNN